jgi:peroxiredoxin
MKKMKCVINFSIFFVFIISCKSKIEKKDILKHESIISKVLGTQLKLPLEFSTYDYLNSYKSDSTSTVNANFKIYSRINASCATCINHIDQWRDLRHKLDKYNTSIILMFHSEDDFEYLKYLCESGEIKKIQFPLFLDNKNKFIKLNTFMQKHKHFETVLTDKNNYILAMGNPTVSKEIEDIFLKEIKKLSN